MSRCIAATTSLFAPLAFAHSGHGAASASHWHASDVLGFVVVGVVATAAIWFTRGKK